MMATSPVQTIADGWKLIHDPDNRGLAENWPQCGIPQDRAVPADVPGFVHQYLPDCFGIAWYENCFRVDRQRMADELYLLRLARADFLCSVYVNGELVGTHRGGEDPFAFDVTAQIHADRVNRLIVRVAKPYTKPIDGYDFCQIPHRNQTPTGLQPGSCFNEYGLAGSVELAVLPKLRLSDVFVHGNTETGCLDIELTIRNDFAKPVRAVLEILCGDKSSGEGVAGDACELVAACGDTLIRRSIKITHFRWWDIDEPNLYFAHLILSGGDQPDQMPEEHKTRHEWQKHFGFRTFAVRDNGCFYLNGRRIFLRCSHTGNCMPESTHHLSRDKALIRRDFVMAKAAGLNMVRFISGAALPEQLDYCDELGLMVYEEPVASWLMQDGPLARELYQEDLLTMVRRDRSHPCLTIWGLLNETPDKPPYADVCRIARDSLPALRQLDQTRLVLYSSGRWDGDASVGSVANPDSTVWECLWNHESEPNKIRTIVKPGLPGGFREGVGDVHIYPRVPYSAADASLIRTLGQEADRPVFVSEYGIGSLFDVIWLCRKFEATDARRDMPDVAMIYRMAAALEADLRRYGMENEFAFPIDLLRQSQQLHARQRAISLDLIRANPNICGLSLTGLLDHSICGEGLWTLMREWKPGIADVLQNGLAPLKWCLFLSDNHVYGGRPFTIEGILANEDVLQARTYPIGIRIIGQSGIVFDERLELDITVADLDRLAVPVFKRQITLDLPTGDYELHAEILEGAAAFDGMIKFHITDYRDILAGGSCGPLAVSGINDATRRLLADQGIPMTELADADQEAPSLVLVGDLAEEAKEPAWAKIRAMLQNGSIVCAASRYALARGDDYSHFLPLADKPQSNPKFRGSTDWLYHKEYLAKRGHGYFTGLPTGMMDWAYYQHLISGCYFTGGQIPDDTAAACFVTGWPSAGGYAGGFNIGAYKIGPGTLIINAFNLLENIGLNPAADLLLLNILRYSAAAAFS